MDTTERVRREMVMEIASRVESSTEDTERLRLEQEYGQVWNTKELSAEFEVDGFMAPFIVAIKKSDGKKGSMMFQDRPRFYFSWKEVNS